MQALLDARREGVIKQIGVSNFSLAQLLAAQRSLGDVPLASLQADYSLLERRVEPELLPHCREAHVGLLAYSPLAAGHLARPPDGAAGSALHQAMTAQLLPMAAAHGVPASALALAWLLARPGVTAAITGISQVDQLREQALALTVTLTPPDVERLDAAFTGLRRPDEPLPSPLQRALGVARQGVGMGLRKLGLDPSRIKQRMNR
jgi:aryl-alcohol dehydrogenase-like predicted oxidoreductase